jgi:hypothetical protein
MRHRRTNLAIARVILKAHEFRAPLNASKRFEGSSKIPAAGETVGGWRKDLKPLTGFIDFENELDACVAMLVSVRFRLEAGPQRACVFVSGVVEALLVQQLGHIVERYGHRIR